MRGWRKAILPTLRTRRRRSNYEKANVYAKFRPQLIASLSLSRTRIAFERLFGRTESRNVENLGAKSEFNRMPIVRRIRALRLIGGATGRGHKAIVARLAVLGAMLTLFVALLDAGDQLKPLENWFY